MTNRAGRPAKHLRTWPHPYKKYATVITLMQGIQPGNEYVYADFLDEHGMRMTKNPVSLRTKDKTEAEEAAIEMLGEIKNRIATNQPTGRLAKNTFGFYAARLINRLLEKTAQHGYSRSGRFRGRMLEAIGQDVAKHITGRKAGVLQRKANAQITQQALSNGKRPDKGHAAIAKVYLIDAHLLPKWGTTPIHAITQQALNQWVRDELRLHQGPRKGEMPTKATLNGLDAAFALVWKEAEQDGAIDENRKRPKIDRNLGVESGPRTFFADHEIAAMARYIKQQWPDAPFDTKLVYLYIALTTCGAVRPGLEILDTKIAQVIIKKQYDETNRTERDVHFVRVKPHAGKYETSRTVTVYQGPGLHFDVINMLSDVLTHWQTVLSPREFLTAGLFGEERSGGSKIYGNQCQAVFDEVGILYDPLQPKLRRRAYHLRHFFATKNIEMGKVDIYQLAKWMGTSLRMIEKHYDDQIMENDGWKIDGYLSR